MEYPCDFDGIISYAIKCILYSFFLMDRLTARRRGDKHRDPAQRVPHFSTQDQPTRPTGVLHPVDGGRRPAHSGSGGAAAVSAGGGSLHAARPVLRSFATAYPVVSNMPGRDCVRRYGLRYDPPAEGCPAQPRRPPGFGARDGFGPAGARNSLKEAQDQPPDFAKGFEIIAASSSDNQ